MSAKDSGVKKRRWGMAETALLADKEPRRMAMIPLTRINGTQLFLNSDLIEHLEVTPDTVVSLTNGQKFVVLGTPEEVAARVMELRRSIHRGVDDSARFATLEARS
jgi:flagellar protein FlbD